MKILFIQLPLIDHSSGYVFGNIEYAPSALSGYIRKKYGKQVRTSHLPFMLSGFASDSVIEKYILMEDPDIICFTCYLWNIERNLSIAGNIKRLISKIKIIFGGPEINSGSFILSEKRGEVDIFATGEGEWFFDCFLSNRGMEKYKHLINGNAVFIQPANELLPVSQIFEPLSGNLLDTMPDGSVFLELTRGCPYRCSYCYYSKNCNIVRELPFEILTDILESRNNIREIYILSPALNTTENFKDKMKLLAEKNKDVKLHSEMRSSQIDNSTARLLYDAGFRSIEVGLQTLNTKSLKHVRRNSDPDSELRGMDALKNAGIDLKIGIIPGLPEDSTENFISTVDRLVNLGFGDEIELYPLMILPGTLIRDEAERRAISFQGKPPYFYHHGWGMSFEDICRTREYVENITGFSMTPGSLPNFNTGKCQLHSGVKFNVDDIELWELSLKKDLIQTNIFNFHITAADDMKIYNCIPSLLQELPENELYNFILYFNFGIDENRIVEIINNYESDNFYRRLNIFNKWGEGVRFRLFQVFSNYENLMKYSVNYFFIEPVLHIGCENHETLKIINTNLNILIGEGVFREVKEVLIERFKETPESVAFENETEQKEFYRLAGYDHVDLPFTFSNVTYGKML